MRHPDRRQAERRRRSSRWAASRRGSAGSRAARRSSRAIDAATRAHPRMRRDRAAWRASSRRATASTSTSANPCASRCARIAATNVAGSQPTTKRSCRCAVARGGIAFTGCSGLPVTNASTSSAFQREHALGRRQPRLAPVAIDRGTAGLARLDRRKRARAPTSGIGGGRSPSTRMRPRASTSDAIALREDRPGIGEQAAPVARVMAALAQVDGEVEVERAARAQEQRRPRRAQARAVGGDQHVGAKRRRARARTSRASPASRSPRRSRAAPCTLKPSAAARLEHARERGEVDAVLALVVGGAAAVPAVAFARRASTATGRRATARRSRARRRRGRR